MELIHAINQWACGADVCKDDWSWSTFFVLAIGLHYVLHVALSKTKGLRAEIEALQARVQELEGSQRRVRC
jgi:hypothetical protein